MRISDIWSQVRHLIGKQSCAVSTLKNTRHLCILVDITVNENMILHAFYIHINLVRILKIRQIR